MKRHSWSRRLLFVVCLAVGPVLTACEAILDFDRTPLQPVPEASVPAEGSTSIPDARPDRGTSSSGGEDSGGEDTGAPVDAGRDADADATVNP